MHSWTLLAMSTRSLTSQHQENQTITSWNSKAKKIIFNLKTKQKKKNKIQLKFKELKTYLSIQLIINIADFMFSFLKILEEEQENFYFSFCF